MPRVFISGLPGPPISNDEVMVHGFLLLALDPLFGATLRVNP
jgi:hypothetical protein